MPSIIRQTIGYESLALSGVESTRTLFNCAYPHHRGDYISRNGRRFLICRSVNQASTIPKYCLNSSFASLTPLSFTTTDLAAPLGFEIYPFSCNLSKASQSKPFQARQVDFR
jgi:hypothetical protein